jgi:hypothetical protein
MSTEKTGSERVEEEICNKFVCNYNCAKHVKIQKAHNYISTKFRTVEFLV